MGGITRRAGDELVTITVRPQVSMGAFQALGYVCAMGVVEGLRAAGVDFAGIGWPTDVVDRRTHQPLLALELHAGFNRGMFATCAVRGARQVGLLRDMADDVLTAALTQGVEERVASWEAAIAAGRDAAGPLAPLLSDYFDLVALMGEPVAVVYTNGNEMARGRFAGVDIWGKATVVTDDGRQLEFPPEQASIRPA